MTVSELGAPLLVGKTVGDALKYCMSEVPGGWSVRVTCRDGVHLPVTRDLRYDRLNVDVKNGTIISQYIG